MYKLSYHQRVIKFLRKLNQSDVRKVLKKIELLQSTPTTSQLNIKRLETRLPTYRLRVGKIRIIYTINEQKKTIYLMKMNFRGGIYKN